MSAAIPREIVADALGVDGATLPAGDLPVDRFAARYLDFLRSTDEMSDFGAHPEVWTHLLFDALTRDHPDLALAAIRAALSGCATPEEVATVAAGPLEDLLQTNGAAVIDAVEALAARAPRFACALTGVWAPNTGAPLLWARVRALTADTPALDDGAPLPPADGLG